MVHSIRLWLSKWFQPEVEYIKKHMEKVDESYLESAQGCGYKYKIYQPDNDMPLYKITIVPKHLTKREYKVLHKSPELIARDILTFHFSSLLENDILRKLQPPCDCAFAYITFLNIKLKLVYIPSKKLHHVVYRPFDNFEEYTISGSVDVYPHIINLKSPIARYCFISSQAEVHMEYPDLTSLGIEVVFSKRNMSGSLVTNLKTHFKYIVIMFDDDVKENRNPITVLKEYFTNSEGRYKMYPHQTLESLHHIHKEFDALDQIFYFLCGYDLKETCVIVARRPS